MKGAILIAAVAAAAYLIYDNWGAIVGWLSGVWESIKSGAMAWIEGLVSIFLTFTPLGLLIRAFMPALAYLRSLNFTEIGQNLIQGLINGVTGMLGALKSTIVGAASSVANWFKSKLGIHSPSRVFAPPPADDFAVFAIALPPFFVSPPPRAGKRLFFQMVP